VGCVVLPARRAQIRRVRLMTRPAIEVDSVAKSFLIPHEQQTTFKELFLHPFRRATYEANEALQHLSFEVAEVETFGIICPDGSGKQNLLKLLDGLYRPDRGSIRIN